MAATIRDLLSSVRKPEYTGRNRCQPCTIVNVGIAIVAAVVSGWIWIPVGVAVFLVSILAIYL